MSAGAGRRRRAARRAAFLALVFAIPARVEAHPGHVILRSERFLKLDVSASGARFVVSESMGAEEFLRQSRRADANGDGRVSRDEANAHLGDYATMLRRELPARLDGSFIPVDWDDPFFEPIGDVSARPGTLELVGRVRIPPGRHTLVLTDDTPQETLERTDVAFTVRDGVTLEASGANDAPTEVVRTLAFGKGAERRRIRSLAMTIVVPEPRFHRPTERPIGFGAVFLLLSAWSTLAVAIDRLLRERRSRDRPRTFVP